METKKILMVTSFYPPYHVGGACVHVYNLANELAKRGHEIHVLYSKDAYYLKRKHKPNEEKYRNHENVHVHEIKNRLGIASPIYSYVSGFVPFKRNVLKIFSQRYDTIHYHNLSLLGPKVMEYGNSRKVYTAHDHWLVCPLNDYFCSGKICSHKPTPLNCSFCLLRNKRPLQLWRFSKMLERGLKNIQLIISPSNYLKNFLAQNSINNKIIVLPNFVPKPPKQIEKNQFHVDYFFYAGMLEAIKGIPNLLNAFKESEQMELVIAGKGSLEKYVKKFIKKNQLQNVRYVNWLNGEEIYSYYANARAFILPSLCPENCPLTILEAFSVGTAVIGPNIGGIPEIISKVDKKLIFNYGDVENLKEKITNFNKDEYDKEMIKKVFEDFYSPDAYIEEYLNIINGL